VSDNLFSYSPLAAIDGVSRVLVVVPCGKSKIWDCEPHRGPAVAADAYTGTPFRLNRQYAEHFGDVWVVLSAKYGFIASDFSIPAPYEVSFKYPATGSITVDRLREQVRERQLDRYPVIVGLGGKAYRAAVEATFADSSSRLVFPFAGLPLGKSLQAVKHAITSGDPGFSTSGVSDGQSR
jgi:hypothetical protein